MAALQLPSPAVSIDPDDHACSDGYAVNSFENKPEQMDKVVKYIQERGFLPAELTETEVAWFYK